MKKVRLKLSSLVLVGLGVVSLVSVVNAVGLLPEVILKLLGIVGPGGICASTWIQSRVQFVMILALGGVVLVAVGYALMAAFKYISSQGESGKMEEAQKSIKAIFIGIAAMLIAIIGIVLVFAVFGASPSDPNLYQTCINAPQSKACADCRDKAGDPCKACEDAIVKYCQSDKPSQLDNDASWDEIKTAASLTEVCK
jgi:heme/copper-type cytochrome/quinol oxidase subunit 2